MLLHKLAIGRNSFVNDIVRQHHHTADVFRKYGIDYCCGGKWPLETVCLTKGLEFDQLKKELENAGRVIQLPPMLAFETWNIDFLTSYIINIHHRYLKDTIADTGKILRHFADGHIKQYPEMQEAVLLFEKLQKEILPHIQYEEETIFPYVIQVVHAYENNDTYAKLLVKTLRKPLDVMMRHEEDVLSALVLKIRLSTNNYTIPGNACVSHVVALSRLKELDNDLMQHIYLENEILFPRALQIERELLKESA
jgi:regulator of cell morphogenesis and NO signaling